MDIVTHLMMDAAATSPLWESHPLESVALWVLFIDGTVIALTASPLATQGWLPAIARTTSDAIAVGFFAGTGAYFLTRGMLRRRAATAVPDAFDR